ncbi:hypothetical protein PG996_004957 [Apiospora saccharicola]|uniref:Ubiquitin-like domain-containing protein n=1 Tax=Apiospora saccharicola TaxID=335842 RepID=A0ABR1VK50_9PEZI
MSASFSFGSFGDIITTAQLVWRLARALSDSRGSAPEFQELVKELNLFYGALSQLTKFWQSKAQTAELQRLAAEIQHVADDCRRMIESFLEKGLKRYGKSFLKPRDSPKTIGDWLKRARWASLEKDDVTKMRDQLRRNKDILDLIQHAEEQNHDVVTRRLAELEKAGKLASARLEKNLVDLVGALRDQEAIMIRMNDNFAAMRSESHSTSRQLSNIEHTTALLPSIHAGISMYAENHAFIEDALGYKFPVPLIIKPSWDTVHSMIKDMFKNRPGMAMILQRDYVLQDPSTRTDLQLTVDFHGAVRPGQNLVMSMVFRGSARDSLTRATSSETVCPKCGLSEICHDPAGSDKICDNPECGFSYREITDLSEASDDKLKEWLCGNNNVQQHISETFPDTDLSDAETLRQFFPERQATDSPEIFKRVRFLSRWEDRPESRGDYAGHVQGIHLWVFSESGWIRDIEMQLAAMTLYHMEPALEGVRSLTENQVLPKTKGIVYLRFAGLSEERSIPVLVIVCEHPTVRRRIATAMWKIEAVKSLRLGFLILHPLDVGSKKLWEEHWDSITERTKLLMGWMRDVKEKNQEQISV